MHMLDRSQFAKVLKLFINLRLITIFNSNPQKNPDLLIDVFLFSTNLYLDVGFLEMVNLSDLFLVFFYEEGFEMKKMKKFGMKS